MKNVDQEHLKKRIEENERYEVERAQTILDTDLISLGDSVRAYVDDHKNLAGPAEKFLDALESFKKELNRPKY